MMIVISLIVVIASAATTAQGFYKVFRVGPGLGGGGDNYVLASKNPQP